MKGLLVRVGIDQAYGGWNAPANPETGRFVYVPIPERRGTRFYRGMRRAFSQVQSDLRLFAGGLSQASPDVELPAGLGRLAMHLDPDFETLTYGDQGARRGAGIRHLERGDVLAFFAGLRPIRPSPHRLLYALVGIYVIEEVVRAVDVPSDQRDDNAHTRKADVCETDIVARAQPGVSGRLESCIPIGEWRNRAYRVRRDLLTAWGGLSVKDGFIQRSAVPPTFLDAERFYDWFLSHETKLIQRNN